MRLEELVIRYGLFAVFLGSAFEGDFTLILAGVVSHLGIFQFPHALLAGTLGTFLGDSCWYLLGRFRGRRFRAGALYRRVGPKVERLARRIGPWELVACRFIYGTKAASMVFWGLHDLPLRRFAPFDLLGAGVAAGVFATLGYLVSDSATALLGRVRRF